MNLIKYFTIIAVLIVSAYSACGQEAMFAAIRHEQDSLLQRIDVEPDETKRIDLGLLWPGIQAFRGLYQSAGVPPQSGSPGRKDRK